MTHSDLVERAARWLRNQLHCGVVLTELVATSEIPDAIGWVNSRCILVECKSCRNDFWADLKKPQRNPLMAGALGDWRFYLAPDGVIPPDSLLPSWGLYVIRGRSVRFAGGLEYRNAVQPPFQSNRVGERRMLISALRRSQAAGRRQTNRNVA